MKKNVLGPAIVFIAALAGCSGATPVRTEYLLRAETPETAARKEAQARIGIARVTVAPYLDQPGLVIETETREIQPARYHQWAEPLENSLLLYLRTEISKALGEAVSIDGTDRSHWNQSVDVFIEELHGTVKGEALMVATFRISTRDADEAASYRFAKRTPSAEKGYPALVDAEAQLIRELAGAIADALRN
jgi:uncharacterized lipoprotein YmbA